jgi:hypothetical protein
MKKSMNVLMDKSLSADGNRRPVQSAGGCLFLSPVLMAGNNWEMIRKLPGRRVQLIERSIRRKHSLSLHKLKRDWAFKMF